MSAAVHLDILDSVVSRGWRTALVSGHQLAADLGVSRPAVQRALDRATEWGWLALLPAHPGSMRPAKAPRIRKDEQRAVWESNALTEAMCAAPTDGLRGLIASLREPCWSYAPTRPGVGHAAYLLGVADAADLNPQALGITRRTRTEARELLDTLGDPLSAADRAKFAEAVGADEAAQRAADERAEQLKARRTEVAEARDRGARVRTVLRALDPCPRADAKGVDPDDLAEWIRGADSQVLPRLTGRDDEREMVATYRRELRRVAVRRGWSAGDIAA